MTMYQEDERGWMSKFIIGKQEFWLSFTRKGYARGGDIHEGLQFNTVIYGNMKVKLMFANGEKIVELPSDSSMVTPKSIPHVFIAFEDTLMVEWFDHELPPYEKKQFYEPYRKLCRGKNNAER
jgi:hypothetical protein